MRECVRACAGKRRLRVAGELTFPGARDDQIKREKDPKKRAEAQKERQKAGAVGGSETQEAKLWSERVS